MDGPSSLATRLFISHLMNIIIIVMMIIIILMMFMIIFMMMIIGLIMRMPGRQKCEQCPLKGRQWFGKSGWRYGWYTWDTGCTGGTPAIQGWY